MLSKPASIFMWNKFPLKQVLKSIESKSEYTFFYNDAEIDMNRKVTVQANNERIDVILSKILPDCKCVVENSKD